MDNTKMLGEKPIWKLLLKFSLPCVLALLIGSFYNIVDQIFIGNSKLGYLGNAATGISFPIICLANAIAWCLGDGAAAYLSICAGRNDSDSAHKCVGTGILATFIFSVVLSVCSIIFCKPLMTLFGASSQTLDMACDYFIILACFFPFYNLMGAVNSMIRADGSPTYAMIALSVGAALNIILDPICIYVLDWGIRGAAIATVVGQVVSCILCFLYLRKPKSFHLTKKSFKINFSMLKTLLLMGGSTFIIQVAIVVMNILSNIYLFKFGNLSIYGSDIPLSVFSIQTKVFTIVANIAVGIALGGQPIFGYNYGASKFDRVRKTYKMVLTLCLTVGTIASLIFIFAPEVVINMFGSQTPIYMEFAVKSFRIFLCLNFVTCFIKLSAIFFQSIGKPIQSMLTSLIRDLVCYVLFTIVLSNLFESLMPGSGIYGVLVAGPLSDLVAGIVIVIFTVQFFNKLKKKTIYIEEKETEDIKQSKPGFIITIAREHGTKGKEIGKLLSEKLNVPFYCKDLTLLAAKESGLDKEFIVKDYDDYSENLNQMTFSSDVYKRGIIAQEKILNLIADKGSCVIVGRASNYVLRKRDNLLSIFLYMDKSLRIKNIMNADSISENEAKEHVERSDDARKNYYKALSMEEWDNIENYDFALDASKGVEETASILFSHINKMKVDVK